jgi:NAD(P)-dependent dehydrogenase (short-subunit alcohol dehydrogenase family)
MELKGKVCLVTGGTSGIGSAVALEYGRRGASLCIVGYDKTPDNAVDVQRRIEACGQKCLVLNEDLADPARAAHCVELTVRTFGCLDVLVHCAGGAARGSLLDVTPDTWYSAFDIHVHSAFHLARAAVPHMRKRGEGAILLISSAAGARGCAGAIAYGVAKGVIPPFTRSLARELADFNIRVNCVSPGIIRTPFQDYLTPEQVRNNIENRIPLHREGTPQDVAQALVMLTENEFITGADLAIDGGMTMRMV